MVDAEKIVDSSAGDVYSDKISDAAQTASIVTVQPFDSAALRNYADFCQTVLHSTPQNPDFVSAWAANPDADIALVTASNGGRPTLMLPLEIVREGLFTLARHPGGRHSNGSFPASTGKAADMQQQIAMAIRRARPDVDMLALERNERARDGSRNPLLWTGAAQSPNVALAVDLSGGFEAVLSRTDTKSRRKKRRSQLRKFEAAGGYQRYVAGSPEEVDTLLAAFFAMKAERFRQMGITDVFAAEDVKQAFDRMFSGALEKAKPDFVLHGLEIGGVLRAVTGSTISGDRITCEFSSFRDDELSNASPGDYLFFENIREACESGMAIYDFSVGDERYKRLWCDIESRQFDVFLPLTVKGRLLAASKRVVGAAKRGIKENPLIWSLVKRLRRAKAADVASEDSDS